MFRFTNGLIVYDTKTRDEYIKAGFKLVSDIENEVLDGDKTDNDTVIKEKHSRNNSKSTGNKK